jgi:hypothetical protein
MTLHGCWLASLLSLTVIAGSGCEEQERDYVAPVSAGPRRPQGDGGAADSGSGRSGFVPRPGGSASGAAPPGSAVSALSDDEISALCEELDARFRSRVSDDDAARFSCNLLGVLSSMKTEPDGTKLVDRAACKQATAQCLLTRTSAGSAVDCEVLAGAVAGCALHVAAFETCFDAQVERIAVAIDQLECNALSTGDEVDDVLASLDASNLPECATIADECPALLPSGAGSGSGPMAAGVDGCNDSCVNARDARCDDGGDGSASGTCAFGTDCTDCGPR